MGRRQEMASRITLAVFYEYGVPHFSTNIEAMSLKAKRLNGKHRIELKHWLWKTVQFNTDPVFPGLAARLDLAESIKKPRLKPFHLCIFTRKDAAIKTHHKEHPNVYKRGLSDSFQTGVKVHCELSFFVSNFRLNRNLSHRTQQLSKIGLKTLQ